MAGVYLGPGSAGERDWFGTEFVGVGGRGEIEVTEKDEEPGSLAKCQNWMGCKVVLTEAGDCRDRGKRTSFVNKDKLKALRLPAGCKSGCSGGRTGN